MPGGIFHCEDCGICRVGLPEDFWHCETCGACYTVASRSTHVCVERALQSDCPVTPPGLATFLLSGQDFVAVQVCMEYLFTSRDGCFVGPRCGHAMHPSCFEQMVAAGNYNCPVCEAPLVDLRPATVVRSACRRLLDGLHTPGAPLPRSPLHPSRSQRRPIHGHSRRGFVCP